MSPLLSVSVSIYAISPGQYEDTDTLRALTGRVYFQNETSTMFSLLKYHPLLILPGM